MKTTKRESVLLRLLAQARRLDNQTCRNADEVAVWHIAVDRVLEGTPFDDRDERFDAPALVRHRELVDSLFRPWGTASR